MSIRFFIQNAGWSILNPNNSRLAIKAMNEYRKEHPNCEITGSNKKVQVHHIIPVWANPELAADKNNMISLSTSANIHLLWGHNGNFKNYYIKNVKEISNKIRNIICTSDIVKRDSSVN